MQVKTLLKLSVAAAIATIAMKSLAWWITDSVGLLSDAMESFVNLASALFAIAMVTIAQRPADDDHPFGHSKAEYFSSGFEGLLIAGAAAGSEFRRGDADEDRPFPFGRSLWPDVRHDGEAGGQGFRGAV